MTAGLNPRQDQALRLLQRGFVVIPAGNPIPGATKDSTSIEQGKVPIAREWQNSPMPTEQGVFATWSGDRPPNISVLTGPPSGIWVLDIDPDAGGFETMKALVAQHGQLPSTYVVQTGSGGWHYYFAYPDFEMRNTKGKIGPGIDTRATGGQVIAAGSASHKGAYLEVNQLPVAPAPEWILALLRPVEPTPAAQAASNAQPASAEQMGTYERSIVTAELSRLDALRNLAAQRGWQPGDGWDTITFEVACVLSQMANSDWTQLTHDEVEILLLERAPRDASWGENEIRAKLTSARARTAGKTRQRPAAVMDIFAGIAGGAGFQDAVDSATPWQKYTHDDFGMAERIVALHSTDLLWVSDVDRWAVHDSGRWVEHADGGERAAIDTIRRMGRLEGHLYDDETPVKRGSATKTERGHFYAFCADERSASKVRSAAATLRYTGVLNIESSKFDQKPEMLNVKNGVIDLLSGALLDHDPNLLLRRQSPVVYDPNALCPTWDAFLNRVMPSMDMRNYLQRVVGYSITGLSDEQIVFLHHGVTKNGKSVFLDVMEAILGDYSQTVPATTLLAKKMEQHPTDIARMEGRRFLQLAETPKGARLDEALVKRLSGGDTVAARGMGQDFREFKIVGKVHLVTNHLPHINHDEATMRRLHLIKWGVTIPEAERDRQLAKRMIAAELPGMLAWAVRGTQEWRRHGLAQPVEARVDTDRFITEEDEFGRWLDERTQTTHEGVWTETGVLYRNYAAWCEAANVKQPLASSTFGRELQSRGFEQRRTKDARSYQLSLKVAYSL
jgi:putative DNA primase/helicase